MAEREEAICLRVGDYSETSQVVSFLTRGHGLVRLLAKGSKRRKSKSGGQLDVFCEGQLVYIPAKSDGLGTLTEFAESVVHSGLRRSSEKLYAGQYLLELAGAMLAETDPHPEVFDLLHNALTRLGEDDAPIQAVVAYFQWRLLGRVGLLGQMRACAGCGRDLPGDSGEGVWFSSLEGGLVCDGCRHSTGEACSLSAEALEGLAALIGVSAGRRIALPDAAATAVNRMLAYHIQHQLGRRLKLARYVFGG